MSDNTDLDGLVDATNNDLYTEGRKVRPVRDEDGNEDLYATLLKQARHTIRGMSRHELAEIVVKAVADGAWEMI